MNVTLPPALESLVQQKLASGKYHDPGDVIREALRRMLESDERLEALREEFRSAVVLGFDTLDQGGCSVKSVEQIADEALARHQLRKSATA